MDSFDILCIMVSVMFLLVSFAKICFDIKISKLENRLTNLEFQLVKLKNDCGLITSALLDEYVQEAAGDYDDER